jgi:hypothetical protein
MINKENIFVAELNNSFTEKKKCAQRAKKVFLNDFNHLTGNQK